MSDRGRKRSAAVMQAQVDHRQHNESHALEDAIMTSAGVQATVKITQKMVSIRAASYVEYVIAKNAIKGMVSQPIVQG